MLGAGAVVAVEAVRRLVNGGAVQHIGLAIAVMAGSAAVSLAVALRVRRVARDTGSPALDGDATHLMADVATSAGILAGLILVAATGWQRIDALAALVGSPPGSS